MGTAMYSQTHRGGRGWLTTWTPERVVFAPDPVIAFASYAQQTLGVPWPTQKDINILRRKCSEFFEAYPNADYYTLCRLVQWNRTRRKRFDRVPFVIDTFREAYRLGALPELDFVDYETVVEERITDALAIETKPYWRNRLLSARGAEARREVLAEWTTKRGTLT